MVAEFERLLEPRSSSGRFDRAIDSARAGSPRAEGLADPEHWEDGRPKGWPTLQLRVRGRPFDIYCEHSSDVTLDGIGIPVVNGRTVGRQDLARGWFSAWATP